MFQVPALPFCPSLPGCPGIPGGPRDAHQKTMKSVQTSFCTTVKISSTEDQTLFLPGRPGKPLSPEKQFKLFKFSC